MYFDLLTNVCIADRLPPLILLWFIMHCEVQCLSSHNLSLKGQKFYISQGARWLFTV